MKPFHTPSKTLNPENPFLKGIDKYGAVKTQTQHAALFQLFPKEIQDSINQLSEENKNKVLENRFLIDFFSVTTRISLSQKILENFWDNIESIISLFEYEKSRTFFHFCDTELIFKLLDIATTIEELIELTSLSSFTTAFKGGKKERNMVLLDFIKETHELVSIFRSSSAENLITKSRTSLLHILFHLCESIENFIEFSKKPISEEFALYMDENISLWILQLCKNKEDLFSISEENSIIEELKKTKRQNIFLMIAFTEKLSSFLFLFRNNHSKYVIQNIDENFLWIIIWASQDNSDFLALCQTQTTQMMIKNGWKDDFTHTFQEVKTKKDFDKIPWSVFHRNI